MLRFLAGVASALLLVAAGFFLWKSRAESEEVIPPAPASAGVIVPLKSEPVPTPPAASANTKEEKRFSRADRDDDGRITRAELLQPREKAFAKLDRNGNGTLSFEEWAVTTITKFDSADRDRSGWLTPKEYEVTKPKPPKKKACRC
jgi:hypothetical protein